MSRGIKYCLEVDMFDDAVTIQNPNGPVTFEVDDIGTLIIFGPDNLQVPFQAYAHGNWKKVICYEEEVPSSAKEST